MPSVLIAILAVFFAQATHPPGELKPRIRLEAHAVPIRALAFTNDGNMLISADESGMMLLWDIRTAKQIRALGGPKNAAVLTLSISSDGQTLVSAHADDTIRTWNLKTGAMMQQIHVVALTSARLAPAGDAIVATRGMLPDNAADTDHIILFNAKTGKRIGNIDADFEFVSDCILSPDGKMLAISGGESLTDIPANKGGRQRCRIDLWEMQKDNANAKLLRAVAQNSSQPLLTPTFSAGGKLLAAACGEWQVYETAGGKQVATLKSPEFRARSCAISLNVRWIASGAIDSTVALFDTHDWMMAYQNQSDPSLDANAMCFSPDGTILATARGRFIDLFDVPSH